jgi:hypothetical protein
MALDIFIVIQILPWTLKTWSTELPAFKNTHAPLTFKKCADA